MMVMMMMRPMHTHCMPYRPPKKLPVFLPGVLAAMLLASHRRIEQRRAPAWEHLGLLGPVIRGVVGDTIHVTFKNRLTAHNVSLHPHGVWYDKESEGSPYADGLPCTYVV